MARTPKVVEDRRDQIIDAAMRVFSQKGFTKATNKDIAREAGITTGLIYYYFESKEALFKAIVESRTPLKLLSSLPPEVLTLPPESFLRLILLQVLGIVESENFVGMIRVLLPEAMHETNPELTQLISNALFRVLGFIKSYLKAKIEAGELRENDLVLTTQIILGCIMGFVLRRQIIRDPEILQYSHDQIVDAIIETVLSGLSPR